MADPQHNLRVSSPHQANEMAVKSDVEKASTAQSSAAPISGGTGAASGKPKAGSDLLDWTKLAAAAAAGADEPEETEMDCNADAHVDNEIDRIRNSILG